MKKIKAHMLVRYFDADADADGSKEKKLRDELKGKRLHRKDKHGSTVVDNELDEDKGKPPKKPKP